MSKKKNEKKPSEGSKPSAELHPLLKLVIAGDYRRARAEATRILADAASPPEERAAAQDVLSRTGVDPTALAVGAIGLALLAMIAATIFLR